MDSRKDQNFTETEIISAAGIPSELIGEAWGKPKRQVEGVFGAVLFRRHKGYILTRLEDHLWTGSRVHVSKVRVYI